MEREPHSKIDFRWKDILVRMQAPALFILAILIVAAITCVAIFSVDDKTTKLAIVFLLFIGFMQVVRLLAATLGFTTKKED